MLIIRKKELSLRADLNYKTVFIMEKFMNYESPVVETIEVEVEQGFSVSQPGGEGEDIPWG